MAHRIIHQISSNAQKSPILKCPISLTSYAPQSEKAVIRNLNTSGDASVTETKTCQHLSFSRPILSQPSNNPNVNGSFKRFHNIDEEDYENDDDLQVELVHDEAHEAKLESFDNDYLRRFEKCLQDKDYPSQSAKEFPVNKRLQSINSRLPDLKLNYQVINILKNRSEYRRDNRRLAFNEVEHQANIKYQLALRKMHKVGQKIDESQYKITVPPYFSSSKKANTRNANIQAYDYVDKKLQPANILPFGQTDKTKLSEKYKFVQLIAKPKIDLPTFKQERALKVNIDSTKSKQQIQKNKHRQSNTLEQPGAPDEFTEQMKMLEPNYEPQKRYRSLIRNEHNIHSNKTKSRHKFMESKSDLKSCQFVINQLKQLDPDYVQLSIAKKNQSEAEAVQSTMNFIKAYRKAIINCYTDKRNNNLHHKIKSQHSNIVVNEAVPPKIKSPTVPIKGRTGSKLNLLQGSKKRRRDTINSQNTPKYTDLGKNTSILHIPIDAKITKSANFDLACIVNTPVETFLPCRREFSTNIPDQLVASEEKEIKKIHNVSQYVMNHNESNCSIRSKIPTLLPQKFAFKDHGSTNPMHKIKTNSFAESKSDGMKNITGKAAMEHSQLKSRSQNSSVILETSNSIRQNTSQSGRMKAPNSSKQSVSAKAENSSLLVNVNKKGENLAKLTPSNKLNSNQNYTDVSTKQKEHKSKFKSYLPGSPLEEEVLNYTKIKSSSFDRSTAKDVKTYHIIDTKVDLQTKRDLTSNNSCKTTKKYLGMETSQSAKGNICSYEHKHSMTSDKTGNDKLNRRSSNNSVSNNVMPNIFTNETLPQKTTRVTKKKFKDCELTNEQSASMPNVGNVKMPKMISQATKENSCSSRALKKSVSKTNSEMGCNQVYACNLEQTQPKIQDDKDISVKLKKSLNKLPVKQNLSLDTPPSPLNIDATEKLFCFKNQDANEISSPKNNVCTLLEKRYTIRDAKATKKSIDGFTFNQYKTKFNIISNKYGKQSFSTNMHRKYSTATNVINMRNIDALRSDFTLFVRTYCVYDPPNYGTKKVPLKRLKKRPGYYDDFPYESDWLQLKHCKTICARLDNPKMDLILRYEEKHLKKKLKKLKASNCPCVEIDVSKLKAPNFNGPRVRPGYVEYDIKTCKPTLCVINKPYRADNIAEVEVKRQKLPVIYPRMRKYSTSSMLVPDREYEERYNKSIYKSIPELQHKLKSSNEKEHNSLHLKNNKFLYAKIQSTLCKYRHSSQFTTSGKVKNSKLQLPPYISYSESRISKSEPEIDSPIMNTENSLEYLQPHCPILRPSISRLDSPSVDFSSGVRQEENFTKIPNPTIKELGKFANVTLSNYNTTTKELLLNKNGRRKPFQASVLEDKNPNSLIIGKCVSDPTIKKIKLLGQCDKKLRIDTSSEDPVGLTSSQTCDCYVRNDFEHTIHANVNQTSSSAIEIKSKKSITDICEENEASEFKSDDFKMQRVKNLNDNSASCSKATKSCNVCLYNHHNNHQTVSIWDRITNYFKDILNYIDPQEDNKAVSLLYRRDETVANNSKHISKSKVDSHDDIVNKTNMLQDESQQRKKNASANYPLSTSEDHYGFPQNIGDSEIESITEAIGTYDSERKLMNTCAKNVGRLLYNRQTTRTIIQSRAYSNKSPKTPQDLLEYFNKIQQKNISNVDEDELTNNILNAINVGMDVIKKSKLPNPNDSYFEMFNQLDSVSKLELQSICPNKDDIHDSLLWTPPHKTTNLETKENKHVVNTMHEFCKNVCDLQNYSVLEYEESERKKTEDLQILLDEILKGTAKT